MAQISFKETRFLFIHDDGESVARKKSRVDTLARSHIMNEYKRKEQSAGLRWLEKNHSSVGMQNQHSDVSQATNTVSRVTINPNSIFDADEGSINERAINNHPLRRLDSSKTQVKGPSQTCHDAVSVRRSRNFQPAIIFLEGGADDPFSSASVKLDTWMHGLIRYFVGVCMPALFSVQPHEIQTFQQTSGVLDDVYSALSNSAHMYALLAMSAAHMEKQQGYLHFPTARSRPFHQDSASFKGKTLRLLKERLARNVDDIDFEMMQTMMKIASAESLTGNHVAQLVHIKAWCKMITVLGGVLKMDWRMAESDSTTGLRNSVGGIFARPVWLRETDPTALPQESMARVMTARPPTLKPLAQRFLDDHCTSLLGCDLQAILTDLQKVVFVSEFTRAYPDHTIQVELDWMRQTTFSVEYRLCLLPRTSSAYSPLLEPIRSSIRNAVLLYNDATLINQVPKAALVPVLKDTLIASEIEANYWAPFTDILFWSLCIGLEAAKDMLEEAWYLDQVVKAADFLQLQSWDGDVAPLLREFFYLDHVQGVRLESLWSTKIEPVVVTSKQL